MGFRLGWLVVMKSGGSYGKVVVLVTKVKSDGINGWRGGVIVVVMVSKVGSWCREVCGNSSPGGGVGNGDDPT